MESHYTVVFSLDEGGPTDDGATPFDLFYYDQLAHQDETIRLTLRPGVPPAAAEYGLVPPLDEVLRTRWPGTAVDWNGTEPLL